MYKYVNENVAELKIVTSTKEANRLLDDGWKLLEVHCHNFLMARYA